MLPLRIEGELSAACAFGALHYAVHDLRASYARARLHCTALPRAILYLGVQIDTP